MLYSLGDSLGSQEVMVEETKKILYRVGVALLVVGIADIAIFIYCIANEISYSSSFNIIAVVAGILLIRGSIHAARIVTLFSAFLLAAFVGLLFTFPFMEPIELRLVDFKLNQVSRQLSIVFMFFAIGFIYWVYHQLSRESVMLARKEAGMSYGFPKQAFALGGILVVGLSYAMYTLRNSEDAHMAIAKASDVYGEAYAYHVTHINNTGGKVQARLTAYNEFEIRSVEVGWNN